MPAGDGITVTVRGKRWKLRRCRLPADASGYCDPPDQEGKEIRVCHTLKGEKELEVLVHELLHAAHWDLGEEAIDEAGRDIARVLWRIGYRT